MISTDGISIRTSDFLTTMDWTGWHDYGGILVLGGKPCLRGAAPSGATIRDVTPTLLVALGLPVAKDMDGRPLLDLMTAEFLAEHPLTAVDTYERGGELRRPRATAEELPKEVEERLRALGYVQ